ncbi:TPA: Biofilm associated protein A [Enterobacter chuandaensis]|uniref:Biofilm associated protein A n=1 Tax=Enterobacter TaxID=547 RepID=UPI002A801E0B|nr:Biofilm associated protein A [Enterobacter sp. 118C5]HDR2622957.1 Biofilm associated protein A [Enterobacter chuandaensis]
MNNNLTAHGENTADAHKEMATDDQLPALVEFTLGDIFIEGEERLFNDDGSQQLLVKGTPGQQVNLSDLLPAGAEPGEWLKARGSVTVEGVQYEVYHHSGIETDILVQTGIEIAPQT